MAGLIARVQLPAAAAGPVQELREAIAAFSDAKPSLAWAETYPGTLSYYLASAFREVWMQPSGTVGLVGFATNALFLRDALDKVGIEAQFVARGEYKSAANLFTQDRYTEAHREPTEGSSRVCTPRCWPPRRLAHIDPRRPRRARRHGRRCCATPRWTGLVDRIGFRDEAYARIAELVERHGAFRRSRRRSRRPPRLYLVPLRPRHQSADRTSVAAGARKSKRRRRDRRRAHRQRTGRTPAVAAGHVQRRRGHHRRGAARSGSRRRRCRRSCCAWTARADRSPARKPCGEK